MNRVRWTTWSAYRAEAFGVIQKGTDLLRSRNFRLLQISVFPAFENPQSWEILLALDPNLLLSPRFDTYSVVRRTWRMDIDYPDIDAPDYAGPDADDPAFESFVLGRLPDKPTIEETIIHVPTSVDAFMKELTALSAPPYVLNCDLPEDSHEYEVSFGSWGIESRFRWLNSGPPAWNELTRATNRILVSLKDLLGADSK